MFKALNQRCISPLPPSTLVYFSNYPSFYFTHFISFYIRTIFPLLIIWYHYFYSTFLFHLVLFRAVDETLYQLSASKVALKQLQSQKINTQTQTSKAPLKGGIFDPESGGQGTPGPGGNNWPRTKARSRGGSFGQQVNEKKNDKYYFNSTQQDW